MQLPIERQLRLTIVQFTAGANIFLGGDIIEYRVLFVADLITVLELSLVTTEERAHVPSRVS
jgi:hypothetical protein